MIWPTLAAVRLASRLEFSPWLYRLHRFVPTTVTNADGKVTHGWTRVLTVRS